MAEEWFYLRNGVQMGPVDAGTLARLVREGGVQPSSYVWKTGMPDWRPASEIQGLLPSPPPMPPPGAVVPPLPPSSGLAGARRADRSVLADIGAKISKYAEIPTLSNVPVRKILMGGLSSKTKEEDIEDILAVGTRGATPSLAEVEAGWPTPRIFWRILLGSAVTYAVLYYGLTRFGNPRFIPGMIVMGAFVVPLAVVLLLFEMNAPRNVSLYQVGKMVLLGGALSLVATLIIFQIVPGSGVGNPIAALLTGVGEETGKALAS